MTYVLVLGIAGFPLGCASGGQPPNAPLPPQEIAPFFRVPEEYQGVPDPYRSPLLFADGSRVTSASQWPKRRAEILSVWEKALGTWPPLLDAPRVELVESTFRGDIRQDQLRLGIGLDGASTQGFLLVPPGRGPFPAVLVVFYEAQSGVGLGSQRIDFGWQLARRGFVTLSIGKPTAPVIPGDPIKARGGEYFGPPGKPLRLEPLSALAYLAANAHTVLA